MTDEQVRDEALTLFLAGHETTADALTWAWYLLSQNPQAEAAFHAELDRVLAGRLPSFDDCPSCATPKACSPKRCGSFRRRGESEGGRWKTILWRLRDPGAFGGFDSPYAVHRDPRWFPDPLAFRPERWLADDPARPKFAYFPLAAARVYASGSASRGWRDAAAGRDRTALAAAAGTRSSRGDACADYAASEARDANDPESRTGGTGSALLAGSITAM